MKKRILTSIFALSSIILVGCELRYKDNDNSNQISSELPLVIDTLTLNKSELQLKVGETFTLLATSSLNNKVSYFSSKDNIATVDENTGLITAIKKGSCIITAKTNTAISNCNVTVLDADKPADVEISISLDKTSATIKQEETLQLTATTNSTKNVVWTSNNNNVSIAVDPADSKLATITGVGVGTSFLRATVEEKTATCNITVTKKDTTPVTPPASDITSLTLIDNSFNLAKNMKTQIVFKEEIDYSKLVFSSSNESVCSVDNGGFITAVSDGSATITITTSQITKTCNVSVSSVATDRSRKGRMIFSDEFDSTTLNTKVWSYQNGTKDVYGTASGPDFWGNSENQYYTQDSISLSSGALKIKATKQNMDAGRTFKSGRICTRDLFTTTFGYVEARMKTPAIDGMWPAFWMLPQPSDKNSTGNEYGSWASNGEIDIMEAKGREKNNILGTIHFGDAWPNNTYITGNKVMDTNTDVYHTYAVDWRSDHMSFLCDGIEYQRLENDRWYSAADRSNPSAPFDKPFYIILNLAVGGSFDPNILPPADFTNATMAVDYVRVYE